MEGKGCCGERSGTSVGYKTVLCRFAPMYTGKAAAMYRVIAQQPGLTRKPRSKITYWIICSSSPFGWHFCTCLYVVSILFWASGLTDTQAAGQAWLQARAVGPGWHHRYVQHLQPWLPSRVTSTDTATVQRSDGNRTVARVRTSFALRMGLFPQISLGLRSVPECISCFHAAPALPVAFSSLTGDSGEHTTWSPSRSRAHLCAAVAAAQIYGEFN